MQTNEHIDSGSQCTERYVRSGTFFFPLSGEYQKPGLAPKGGGLECVESPLAENLTTHAQPPGCHPSSTSPVPLPAFSCLLHPVKGIPLRDLLPWLRAFHFEQTSRGEEQPVEGSSDLAVWRLGAGRLGRPVVPFRKCFSTVVPSKLASGMSK